MKATPLPHEESRALTKEKLGAVLFEHVGLNKRESIEIVESFFEEICHALERGETVALAKFGNFSVRDKPQRPGRNPRTGEAIPIAARRVVIFRASRQLTIHP